MNILMTADTIGGVWNYALELARALAPYGVRVDLAAMGGMPSPAQREAAQKVPGLELFASPYKLIWMEDPWTDVEEAGAWLLALAARLRPALIHLNDFAHGALPWPAPVLMAGHSCVSSWWQAVRGEPAPVEWNRYRRAVTAGLRAADLVVAPTRAMLEALNAFYGPLPENRVIYNARSRKNYRPGLKEPFILSAGRLWDQAKNVAALARVAPDLAWPVRIAGETHHPDGGRVSWPGVDLLGALPPAELADWYGRASVYSLPARYEPFGLSALEAALCGCALVLGDVPTLREVWRDAALFVPPDDTGGLRRTLQSLIDNPVLRDDYARRAQARAAFFTPKKMARDYLDAYDSLIRRHAAGAVPA